jgi:transposase-like protein
MTKQTVQSTTDKLVDELLSQVNPSEILSKDGLFSKLKKQLVERILQSELEHELGYNKHSKTSKKTGNRRNGSYDKTIIDNEGNKLKVEVPRDRDAAYEPQFIPKGVRRFKGFDDQVYHYMQEG